MNAVVGAFTITIITFLAIKTAKSYSRSRLTSGAFFISFN